MAGLGRLTGMAGPIPGKIFAGGIQVFGVKETQISLALFASRAVKNVVIAGTKGAQLIEREAIELVSTGPLQAVDTGLMRASTKAFAPEEIGLLRFRWRIGVHPGYTAPGAWIDSRGRKRTKPFYVLYVHEGREGMAARPYIRTAMQNKKKQVEALIGGAIADAMRMCGTGR